MFSFVLSSNARDNIESIHWLRIHFADAWTIFRKMLFDQFGPHLSCLLKKAKNIKEGLRLETDST